MLALDCGSIPRRLFQRIPHRSDNRYHQSDQIKPILACPGAVVGQESQELSDWIDYCLRACRHDTAFESPSETPRVRLEHEGLIELERLFPMSRRALAVCVFQGSLLNYGQQEHYPAGDTAVVNEAPDAEDSEDIDHDGHHDASHAPSRKRKRQESSVLETPSAGGESHKVWQLLVEVGLADTIAELQGAVADDFGLL